MKTCICIGIIISMCAINYISFCLLKTNLYVCCERAIYLCHSISQLHYQRAHILLALDRPEDALSALELVLAHAPKEPQVYSLLGQTFQRLGNSHEALKNLNIALALDPKENSAMKVRVCCRLHVVCLPSMFWSMCFIVMLDCRLAVIGVKEQSIS